MIIFDLKPKHRDEIRFTRNIEHFYGAHIRRDFAPEEREARGGQVGSPPARPAETPPRGHVECSQPNAAPQSSLPLSSSSAASDQGNPVAGGRGGREQAAVGD